MLSLLLGVLPFVPYALGRWTGAVPGPAQWRAAVGGNHGPWWDQWQAFLILFSWLAVTALAAATLGTGIGLALKAWDGIGAARWLFLSGLLFALSYTQVAVLFWLID